MKVCSACGIAKQADGFYADRRTPGGLKSQCKACHSRGNVRTRNVDAHRARNAIHMRKARAADPEKFRSRDRARPPRDMRKKSARARLNTAVRLGHIVRPSECSRCGNPGRVSGHHADYDAPFDVEWLCYPCHGKEHRHA